MKRVAAFALVLLASACTHWSNVPPPGKLSRTGYIKSDNDRVRLHLSDGRVEELTNARVVGDSIVGYKREGLAMRRSAYATNFVKSVDTRAVDVLMTLLAVALDVLLFWGLGYAIYGGQ